MRDTARKIIGVSSKQRKYHKETWWWDEEVQEAYGRRDWRRKGGICRGIKRVNKTLRVQGYATRGEERGGKDQ